MTALLADPAIVSPVLPRRPLRGADHVHPVADRTNATSAWAHRPVVAPVDPDPTALARRAEAAAPVVYHLTDRGIAVVLALIAIVVVGMTVTLVRAYLSVSAAPPATPVQATVVAAPLAAQGRA